MIENFELQPETRWRFFTDGVMGGVSTGQVSFLKEGDRAYADMTGTVSTENNGGFIQMRMELLDGAPEDAEGVRLIVRGNDQTYFVHLRTGGTMLPWQFYQAGFKVTGDWGEVRLPFDAFKRSGRLLRAVHIADSLKSIAVVAYGRDHEAEIDVRELGFYKDRGFGFLPLSRAVFLHAFSRLDQNAAQHLNTSIRLADHEDFSGLRTLAGERRDVHLVGHEHQTSLCLSNEVARRGCLLISRREVSEERVERRGL